MGNWRTVNITGTMNAEHADALRAHLNYAYTPGDPGMRHFGPLSFSAGTPSLCGLGAWPGETVNAQGNLAERGYTVDDVAETLRSLLHIAPSMLLKVHCGGENESDECVATISVGEGLVVVGPAERATITGPSEAQIMGNLLRHLAR